MLFARKTSKWGRLSAVPSGLKKLSNGSEPQRGGIAKPRAKAAAEALG